MCKGDTVLKEKCRYLVRRQIEVFLEPGENAPISEDKESDLSQDELLKKPVYIEHRPKKDPRDLHVLDPACGSGHFLLYAFDLLKNIYEEAWKDQENPKSEIAGRTLRDEFDNIDDLRRVVPKLIIEHNLHGIDIDPRCAQIATLALWLRAQKAWKNLDINAVARPHIVKSNIVTAEPMPGEANMKDEFTDSLKPRVFGQLVDVVFDKMKLAGEAGSLLKIEEEIKDAVAEAKKQWLKGSKPEQAVLFPKFKKPEPDQLHFDISGVTDERFWEQAEDRILDALKEYAEQVESGLSTRRRLFAEDSARGFAFIDLCRKRYDVILMNPPFGVPSEGFQADFRKHYTDAIGKSPEILAAFIDRAVSQLNLNGRVGAITNRTSLFAPSMSQWRDSIIYEGESELEILADLGAGVLDAMVETAAYCISRTRTHAPSCFIRAIGVENKGSFLSRAIKNPRLGIDTFVAHPNDFQNIPSAPLAYWAPRSITRKFVEMKSMKNIQAIPEHGLSTKRNFRFTRAWWEVDEDRIGPGKTWEHFPKGGEAHPFYAEIDLVVKIDGNAYELKEFWQVQYPYLEGKSDWLLHPESDYHEPGLTYTHRTTSWFAPRILPADCYFSAKGLAIICTHKESTSIIGGICSSATFRFFLGLRLAAADLAARSYDIGLLASIPVPWPISVRIGELFIDNASDLRLLALYDENSHYFLMPALVEMHRQSLKESHDAWMSIRKKFIVNVCERAQLIDNLSTRDYNLDEDAIHAISNFGESSAKKLLKLYDNGRKKTAERNAIIFCMLQWFVGVALGRWEIRIALTASLAPKLPNLFDSLPVCQPGMLVGPDGLSAGTGRIVSEEWLRARPDSNTLPSKGTVKNPTITNKEYPLRVSWDGILVDDPDHQEDIVRRVREVLTVIWGDRADSIEQEACEILKVKSLRDYFGNPNKFFADHLKRYSKSRRYAPIYWPLSTESGSYTLWIYYHQLDDQILFKSVNDLVEPKIHEVTGDIEHLQKELSKGGESKDRDKLEQLMDFRNELKDFNNELLRIAKLSYKPDLNDGVIINAAPLWRLFRLKKWQKKCKECWEKLEEGDHDWAHMAYNIWPDRVRDKCKTDKSIAIAHDLEELYIEPEGYKHKKKKKRKKDEQQELEI